MSTKLQQASQIVLKIIHILYSDEFLNKYWAPTTCQALGLIYRDKDKGPLHWHHFNIVKESGDHCKYEQFKKPHWVPHQLWPLGPL